MTAVRVQAERTLLAEVLLRLRSYPVLPIATPNGLHIPARTEAERAIKARMINRMRADGMMVAGAADLVLLWGRADGSTGAGFVELKRPAFRDIFGHHPAGVASDDQKEFARRCARLGINHAYIRGWDQMRAQIGEWGALP